MRRLRRDDDGQAMVEFSLLLPIMLLVILGLFDLARAVWQENTLAYAAREGTRYAIVHGSTSSDPSSSTDNADIAAVVRAAAIGVPNVTVTVTYPDTLGTLPCNERGCRVAVDATAPFVPMPSQYLLNGAFTITLRGGSLLVIQ